MTTMQWYNKQDYIFDDNYPLYEDQLPGCCGYTVAHGFPVSADSQNDHWLALVDLLNKANEGIPELITLNSATQKKMIDLVEATPYWTPLHKKPNMAKNGFIHLYLIEVK